MTAKKRAQAVPEFVVTMTGDRRHLPSPTGRTLCARLVGAPITGSSPPEWSAWPLCSKCERRQRELS